MGTDNKTSSADISAGVETAVSGRRAASIMMDDRTDTSGKPAFRDHDGSGVTAEIGGENLEVRTRGGAEDQGAEEEDFQGDLEADEAGEGNSDTDPGAEGEDGSESDLGDFDPADADSVARYEGAFLTAEGGPKLDALMGEYGRNEESGEGQLNEGTYKFLEDRFGLTRDQIKDIEAGQKAKRDAEALGFHTAISEAAGGADLNVLVAWGKEGGYTPAQRKKFNTDINSSDPEVAAAAVALLKQRYDRANPPRKGVSPKRDATANAGRKGTGVEPFKSQGDYRTAFKEARTSGDAAKLDIVRRRLRVSPFYKSGG